ncbi:MAG: hypothetical protein K6B46_05260 [Opitutales bacterium]|nr:hypothetical protein [Opitutales bacterium]
MKGLQFYALALALTLAGCYAPPEPPALEAGTAIPVRYATFDRYSPNDFKRIEEYFTDKEATGRQLLLRSDPAERGGAYLTLGLESCDLPAGTTIELFYCLPATTGYFHRQWTLEKSFAADRFHEIMIGITDCGNAVPNAWRFVITAPDGTRLAARSSFLWSTYNGKQN